MLVVMNLLATEVASKTTGGATLGARSVFTDDLREKATNVPVGTHNGVCFRARQPDMWVCHGGWDLQKAGPVAGGMTGNLAAGGLGDFSKAKFTMAIYGGTEDFSEARGQIKGDATKYPPLTDYTLEIEIQ